VIRRVNKQILKQLETISAGSIVLVDWVDASVGKSLQTGVAVDVPVQTWGLFIGVLGQKNKHIIIAQSAYRYSDGFFDIEYTAIPVTWTANLTVVAKDIVSQEMARDLLNSFLKGGRRTHAPRTMRQLVRNHG
jgi:hypothetical protein